TQHILGINPINSPYKLIAADVNNSASITTLDVVALQSAILGVNNTFPNNTSWRFIEASHEFANPLDPWDGGFAEIINFNNLEEAVDDAHFIAVKVGDLNSTAEANSAMQPEARTSRLGGQIQIEANENRMDFSLEPGVVAWQVALDCQTLPIGFRVENEDVLWHYSEELQQLRLIWSSDEEPEKPGKVRLTWNGGETPEWTLDPAFSRVYQANGQAGTWDWDTNDRVASGLEVIPNPVFQNARVQVWSPSPESTIRVHSLDGQLLFEQTLDLAAGQHTVELERAIFPTTGIYLVVCETEDGVLTQKISVIQ
ncbi:MAG: T9SS type A sorting domain-containing protein, partial [Bacteroidota bacterium]